MRMGRLTQPHSHIRNISSPSLCSPSNHFVVLPFFRTGQFPDSVAAFSIIGTRLSLRLSSIRSSTPGETNLPSTSKTLNTAFSKVELCIATSPYRIITKHGGQPRVRLKIRQLATTLISQEGPKALRPSLSTGLPLSISDFVA